MNFLILFKNYRRDSLICIVIYNKNVNQGVVTLNLVDVALTAKKIMKDKAKEAIALEVNQKEWIKELKDTFWKILDERLELCHTALKCRHERLEGTLSDISPIHWQNGAIARLNKGETIDKYLHGGYSSISLGYCGLWECVYACIGEKLISPEGESFGLEIMKKLNEYCNKWTREDNIGYSVYGTPLESTTYKFAKCLKKRFGIIKGVTDKDYITNSYHIHVSEPIDAFTKLSFESKFQNLSSGGAISYVEVPNMQNNIPAVL